MFPFAAVVISGDELILLATTKIHSNPSVKQTAAWSCNTRNWLNGEPVEKMFDGYRFKLYPLVETEPTPLQLALICIQIAAWPHNLALPDLLDVNAFDVTSRLNYDPYLRLYVHLITNYEIIQ